MLLEKLHGALVFLRRRARIERAEITPPAGLWIYLARIEPVFARCELADHGWVLRRTNVCLNKDRQSILFQIALTLLPVSLPELDQACPRQSMRQRRMFGRAAWIAGLCRVVMH